jgi:hypothetical protein
MFVIVELLYGNRRNRKGKENDRAWVLLQNLTSVKVEDIRMSIENCKK